MNSTMKHFLTCILLITSTILTVKATDQLELKHVSVVFRHGDRAPDEVEMFPKDPFYNDTFYPEGIGGLTNDGKRREFQLGKVLRTQYDNLLGNLYLPNSVAARSTDYVRTKMSLQLVLSSLYPPKGEQVWNPLLNWQPIPMTYVTSKKDWLMIPEECPEYLQKRDEVMKLPEIQAKINSFESFMKNLTEWTGKNITTPNDMYNLYHILIAESAMKLKVASWVGSVFPHGKLYDGINLWYEIFSYTKSMRRLNGGKLLYKILDDMKKIRSHEMTRNLKMSLYSGHETNVAAVLQVLGVYQPHVPEYSSAVILELYEMNSTYYIKVFYYLGKPSTLVAQQIPGCAVLCPLDQFITLLNDVIPTASELDCDKNKKLVNKIDRLYDANEVA